MSSDVVSEDVTAAGAGAGDGEDQKAQALPRPPRSARRMFCSTLLALEAFVVLFASLAAYGLRAVDPAVILGVGIGGAVLCFVAAGLLRSFVGYLLGTFIQGCLIAVAFLVPQMRDHMLAVGLVFAVLWVVCWRVGARIDLERAERYEEELEHARGLGAAGGTAADGDTDGRVVA